MLSVSGIPFMPTVLNVVCRAALGGCWFAQSVWTTELYPSLVLSRVYGYALGFGYVVSIVAPFVGGTLFSISLNIIICMDGPYVSARSLLLDHGWNYLVL